MDIEDAFLPICGFRSDYVDWSMYEYVQQIPICDIHRQMWNYYPTNPKGRPYGDCYTARRNQVQAGRTED